MKLNLDFYKNEENISELERLQAEKYFLNSASEVNIKELELKNYMLFSPNRKNIISWYDFKKESNILDWTYNSNAIEGNTLTLRETKVVLEGITIGGKSVSEHLEVINHKEAIIFLENLVNKKAEINEWDIKSLHQLILKEIDNKNAGKYRLYNVRISGATQVPCDYLKVPEEMEKLIIKQERWKNYHPIIRSALLHGEFVFIHPFVDGNGRTARLLMNFEAMKDGYLPIIIRKEDRTKYYDALDKAMVLHDYTDFVKLLVEEENRILDQYLEIIG